MSVYEEPNGGIVMIRRGLRETIAEYADGIHDRRFCDLSHDYVMGKAITAQEIIDICEMQMPPEVEMAPQMQARAHRLRQLIDIVTAMRKVGREAAPDGTGENKEKC